MGLHQPRDIQEQPQESTPWVPRREPHGDSLRAIPTYEVRGTLAGASTRTNEHEVDVESEALARALELLSPTTYGLQTIHTKGIRYRRTDVRRESSEAFLVRRVYQVL